MVGLLGLALAGGSLSGSLVFAERSGVLNEWNDTSDRIAKTTNPVVDYSRETRTTVGKEWHQFR